jgi:hypothetical protein
MLPYRSKIVVAPRTESPGDPTVLVAFGLFWILSLVRVVWGFCWHEVFGAELTLALIAVVGLPWLFLGRTERLAPGRHLEAPPGR